MFRRSCLDGATSYPNVVLLAGSPAKYTCLHRHCI